MPIILSRYAPGLLLCVVITIVATVLQVIEVRLFTEPYLEALVLAILLGVIVRTTWAPGPAWEPGIGFSAKILLEIAVVLLGASVSAGMVLALGPALILGIVCVVAVAIASSYTICRALGLPQRMAADQRRRAAVPTCRRRSLSPGRGRSWRPCRGRNGWTTATPAACRRQRRCRSSTR